MNNNRSRLETGRGLLPFLALRSGAPPPEACCDKWVWLKIKELGLRGFSSLVPFAKVPFWYCVFEPQPSREGRGLSLFFPLRARRRRRRRAGRRRSAGRGSGTRRTRRQLLMGRRIWVWVKIQNVAPVNIRFNPTTKKGSKMGCEFTYQPKWYHWL